MKIPRFIACLTALLCMAAGCRSEDDAAVRALARRIIPEHEKQFRFERLTDTTECFELESRGSKIVVRGNSSASIAVGLNHYLKNYCLTTVSWHACNPVEMPAVLPRIDEKVRVESRARERFFLNYCTFGYTMPWWGWTEWERFIDWMALQGVTMPLAITGQEAVWQRVWTRLGLSDEEVRAYFTGPAHLPWHRMSNIDRWQGPLPEEWIDGQLALQQRILARERELGMKPVLPAFAGHVPQELKRLHPDARITRVSYWGGFDDRYRCSFLDPMDPLFAVIQREFLTEQTRLFGTGHIYGADPFNEIDAPTWDPETLAGMSRHIYESMAEVDPEAVWLQMGWLFYADPTHWTAENIRAFLGAVPQDRLLMLDYFCEFTEIWKQTEKFHGQPYLWCYLGNFGGNTMLSGNFHTVSARMEDAFAHGGTLRFVRDETYALLANADAAVVTSGTATLETALFGVPQVVCYKTPLPKLISWLRSRLLHVRYISLVNLIADAGGVPELVADTFSVENIAHELSLILPGGEGRKAMLDGYASVSERLGHEDASQNAARIICGLLRSRLAGQGEKNS